MTWLVLREELSVSQLKAVEAGWDTHKIIMGAPGSGKTQVLMHRAAYIVEQLGLKDDDYHIFVYTRLLKDYLKADLFLLDLPEENVSTFDAWCKNYHDKNIPGPLPKKDKTVDFKEIRKRVSEHIKQHSDRFPIYQFVMVDEGQDLDREAYAILKIIASHVTVCLDYQQQIYEEKCEPDEIVRILQIGGRNRILLEAFRCSPYVTELAATLLSEEKRQQYLAQVRIPQSERLTPLLYYANSREEETRRMIEILRTRMDAGDQIAVLFPRTNMIYGYAQAMKEAQLEVETMNNFDIHSNRPKFVSYYSVKGLTFDTILMPRLIDWAFSKVSDERTKQLLFVGISRARRWVYLSTEENRPLATLELLKACDHLTIQRPGDLLPNSPDDSGQGIMEDDLLDLL